MEIYPKVIPTIILVGKILCGSYFYIWWDHDARVHIDVKGRIVLPRSLERLWVFKRVMKYYYLSVVVRSSLRGVRIHLEY